MEKLTEMDGTQRRKTELSLAGVIMCLLVVFIHVSSEPVSLAMKDSWQFVVIMTASRLAGFAVPGFIFLSGVKLFLHQGQNFDYHRYYQRRFTVVMLPYLIWFFIYYIYFLQKHFIVFDFGAIVKSFFLGNLVAPFYFVVVIVQFYIFVPLWRHWLPRARILPALMLAFMVTLISKNLPEIGGLLSYDGNLSFVNVLFPSYLFYWVAGCLAGYRYPQFCHILSRWCWSSFVGWLAVAVLDVSLFFFAERIFIPEICQIFVRIAYCSLSIFFLLQLAYFLRERPFLLRPFFQLLDRSTYQIFLSHSLVIFMVNSLLDRFAVSSLDVRFSIRAVVTYSVAIALGMLWQRWKERMNRRLF